MLRPGFENFHSQYSTLQSILKILCYMLLGISSSGGFRNSSSEKCDNPTCFHRFNQAFSSTKKNKKTINTSSVLTCICVMLHFYNF